MYLCRNFSILEEMTEDIFGWMLEGILAGISRKKLWRKSWTNLWRNFFRSRWRNFWENLRRNSWKIQILGGVFGGILDWILELMDSCISKDNHSHLEEKASRARRNYSWFIPYLPEEILQRILGRMIEELSKTSKKIIGGIHERIL